MSYPISTFPKGAVVYIDYPYEDAPGKSKRRPAIITDFKNNKTRVVLLKVTSHSPRTIFDYTLKNPKVANLKDGSVVRCDKIVTVPNTKQCKLHGYLSRADLMAVEMLYNQVINLRKKNKQ